jgi:hypothetical protein
VSGVDLVQWLREQLDEDERIARAADPDLAYLTECIEVESPGTMADEAHVLRHAPARVLREIEADRELLRQYVEVAANDVDDVEYAHGWANALGLAVRLRASAFSDRPGFREEWRP